jgi:uncharacterized membrane protein (UPF0127 family)
MQKNMIFPLILIVLAVGLAVILTMQIRSKPSNLPINKKSISLDIGQKSYSLEVADTAQTRQVGLMNRSKLDENGGMIFIFDGTGIYPFWMKDTLIPLDMIWLNDQKEIVHIKENAQPCSTTIGAICSSIIPLKPALYVIELNGGEVEKLGLKTGDKINFEL